MGSQLRFVIALCLVATAASPLRAATIVPIPAIPGSIETDAFAINNKNVVAGTYLTPDGVEHGFFETLDGNYTTFDYPDAGPGVEARGINDAGYITGFANGSQGLSCQLVPFERSPDGSIVTITNDGVPLNGQVQQIDKQGFFAGNYCDGNNLKTGYYGKNGVYVAGIGGFTDNAIAPRGITQNASAGWFIPFNSTTNAVGFVLQTGILTVVFYPDPSEANTYITAINKKNFVTGSWDDGDPNTSNAFALDLPKAKFIPVTIPGANFTQAYGVNDNGIFVVATDIGSFVYCLKQKKCPGGGRHIPDGKPIHVAPETFLHPDYRKLAERALNAHPALDAQPRRHLLRN
jgi:hypothetical protein